MGLVSASAANGLKTSSSFCTFFAKLPDEQVGLAIKLVELPLGITVLSRFA